MTDAQKSRKYPSIFSRVNHTARRALKLNMEEFCLLDMIHWLSTNPGDEEEKNFELKIKSESEVKVRKYWCYASKNYFAKILGLNRVSIQRMIKRLLLKGFLMKHKIPLPNEVIRLATTSAWDDNAYDYPKKHAGYSKIPHIFRQKLGLSCTEFCVLDMVYKYTVRRQLVWNGSAKRWLADQLGLPKTTMARTFQHLIDRGFIEIAPPWDPEWSEETLKTVSDDYDEWRDLIDEFINGLSDGPETMKRVEAFKRYFQSNQKLPWLTQKVVPLPQKLSCSAQIATIYYIYRLLIRNELWKINFASKVEISLNLKTGQ